MPTDPAVEKHIRASELRYCVTLHPGSKYSQPICLPNQYRERVAGVFVAITDFRRSLRKLKGPTPVWFVSDARFRIEAVLSDESEPGIEYSF